MNNYLTIIVVAVGTITYILFTKKENKEKQALESKNGNIKTIQNFINIADIKDNILYTANNNKIMFVMLKTISIDLLNKKDKIKIINNLKSNLSSINYEFDIFAISQPFNIDKLKKQFENDLLNAKNNIQRKLLRDSLQELIDYSNNGNIRERKFYLKIIANCIEKELIDKTYKLSEAFNKSGIECRILNDNEIIKLINLFNNINTYNYDIIDKDDNSQMSFIEENEIIMNENQEINNIKKDIFIETKNENINFNDLD